MSKKVYGYNTKNLKLEEQYNTARKLDVKFGLAYDSFRKNIDRPYHVYKDRYWSYMKADQYNDLYPKEGVEVEPYKRANFPKILFFDLETSPIHAYVWKIFKEYVNPEFIVDDWHLLTWSAKWLFEDKVYNAKLTKDELSRHDDSRICHSLWELLDEADIIIAHNLKKFDERVANTRFLVNGLTPPSPYRTIDTLITLKKWFRFTSNRLDYVNNRLGLNRKIHTDISLWRRCMELDMSAMDEMQGYNDGDVIILEELYLLLRPWIKPHPNVGVFMDEMNSVCAYCGSSSLEPTGKEYVTNVGRYSVYRCNDCGGYSRGRTTNMEKDIRKYLNTGVAR